jgi:hypothetical protein
LPPVGVRGVAWELTPGRHVTKYGRAQEHRPPIGLKGLDIRAGCSLQLATAPAGSLFADLALRLSMACILFPSDTEGDLSERKNCVLDILRVELVALIEMVSGFSH